MAPGEKYKLNVDVRPRTSRPTTEQYLSKVDYDLWLGPAPKRPFNRNRFHYNWHWHWDYGNGDSGNQGPHQFDIARWGLQQAGAPGEDPVDRRLLRRGVVAGDAGHADGTLRVRRRHDPRVRHARRVHERRGQRARSATCSTAPRAGCGSTETGAKWQSYLGPKNEKGPGADASAEPAERHRADDDRVPALPELHRRDPRRRSEAPDLRHPRRATSRRRCRTSATSRTRSATASCSTARRRRSSTTRRRTSC